MTAEVSHKSGWGVEIGGGKWYQKVLSCKHRGQLHVLSLSDIYTTSEP